MERLKGVSGQLK